MMKVQKTIKTKFIQVKNSREKKTNKNAKL